MERIDQICQHPLWKEKVNDLEELEKERIFCGHSPEHLLDVARIAWIENLECGYGMDKAVIYGAALLHDIGRSTQYREGTPHDIAGRELAEIVLKDCAFSQEERDQILDAISGHRSKKNREAEGLTGLIYRADKRSRMCLFCKAEPECNWSREKKNLKVLV